MTEFEFDPLSSAFAANPYPFYARLRQQEEPVWFDSLNMWMVSRYADIVAVTTNPSCVRSLEGIASEHSLRAAQKAANWHDMPYHERVVQFSLLDSDGPVHRRLRKQVFGFFTNDAIGKLEVLVRPFVDDLLDQQGETFDFAENFAAHIPGFLIGTLLGVPLQDHPQLRLWSERIVRYFDVDRSNTLKQQAENATRDFYHYLESLMRQRERAPRDDLISRMIQDKQNGGYTLDEFISTCMLILMAGHGSTIDVLGSAMNLFIHHPQHWKSLHQNPGGLPTALQEVFRIEPPLPFFHRHATQDIEIGGKRFPGGSTFGVLYASGNRDETAFENADTFDITRKPNRHLAFGQGAHLCLGNNLARMNMRVIFECLLERFSKVELTDNIQWKPGLSVRGPKHLMVRTHPR